jgi:non-ribosomal peptide synthetase component E (peptide arylation enzyme)
MAVKPLTAPVQLRECATTTQPDALQGDDKPNPDIPPTGDRPLWATMQTDGNLVVYWYYQTPTNKRSVWDSNTQGRPGSRLRLQNDGNLVVYNSAGKAIWDTNTCCR